MLNIKTLTATCVLVGATALTALPANAAVTMEDTVSTRIKVADIQTAEGLAKTYDRLERAANKQCTVKVTGSRLARIDEACAADLLGDFIESSGVTALAKLHEAKTTG